MEEFLTLLSSVGAIFAGVYDVKHEVTIFQNNMYITHKFNSVIIKKKKKKKHANFLIDNLLNIEK